MCSKNLNSAGKLFSSTGKTIGVYSSISFCVMESLISSAYCRDCRIGLDSKLSAANATAPIAITAMHTLRTLDANEPRHSAVVSAIRIRRFSPVKNQNSMLSESTVCQQSQALDLSAQASLAGCQQDQSLLQMVGQAGHG